MKKIILMSIIAIFNILYSTAQSSDKKEISETIFASAKAGDQSDADQLSFYLDDHYRIVMNRLFGSDKVSVLPKNVYLEKIRSKEFGGDQRKVKIESITLNGNTASAKVSYVGSKMTFVSILSLLKNVHGEWKLVNDVPIVK